MKRVTSYRLSDRTLAQTKGLSNAWNTSAADVISTAIDRAAQQEGIMLTYTTQYWQHRTDGERYIVTVCNESGRVIRAAGPLHYSELSTAALADGFGARDSDAELADDIDAAVDDYRLVTPPYEEDTPPAIRIRWSIATDPSYYGPDAEADDVRRSINREHVEVRAYVAAQWPNATVAMDEVPETTSYDNQSWVEIDGEHYRQADDPRGILEAIAHYVEQHYADWADPNA